MRPAVPLGLSQPTGAQSAGCRTRRELEAWRRADSDFWRGVIRSRHMATGKLIGF
jgi:hypothetical protein